MSFYIPFSVCAGFAVEWCTGPRGRDRAACDPGKYSVVNGASSNTTCVGRPAVKYFETCANDEGGGKTKNGKQKTPRLYTRSLPV